MEKENSIKKVLPVLFGFFVMGLVDLVGIATNYAKQDFALSDTLANMLPMSVFLWFAVLSVPTSILMNKLGRKQTVILSMLISLVAMILPLITYNFPMMLVAFALLGIGNTIIQVALNPLLTDVVPGNRLTSSLTLGQFIKAIAAFLGPIITGLGARNFGSWKLVFIVFAITTIISGLWLQFTSIREGKVNKATSTFSATFGLLKDKVILMLFMGILFVVGVDVGLNITIPKFLMERCSISLEQAGLGTSLYFVARTVGTLIGAILLARLSGHKFFIVSVLIAIPALIVMLLIGDLWGILTLIFVVGFSIANIFSIIFSFALKRRSDKANEVSGLMIMGVAGGAIIPLIMGVLSDSFGQTGGMSLLIIALVYLLLCALRVQESADNYQE